MSAHPDKELLSAHADASAPASERAMLDGHLASCAACRREFAELKAVSKLVADLPQAELPTGFMARLERRRREAEAAPALFTMPALSPLRFAGFATTGLLVCLVFFHEVRYRLAPPMLGSSDISDADTGIQSSLRVGVADEADVESARQAAVQRGEWKGLSEEAASLQQAAPAAAAASQSDLLAPSRERAEPMSLAKSGAAGAGGAFARPKLKAEGAPLGAGAPKSNEQLVAQLEDEKRRMGIQEIVPPGASAPPVGDGLPDRPLSKDEAMDYMRSMTRHLTTLNQNANNKKRPVIALGGATPRILGGADGSSPVGEAKAAAKPAEKGSIGMVRGAAGARFDEPASFDPPPMRRPSYMSAGAPPAAPAAPGPAVPAKPLTPRGFWSASTGGPGTDGGAVLTKAEDWADLWKRVGRTEALPAVDFEKEMAVAVFAKHDAENRRSVEVVSLSEEAGTLVIRYRVADEGVKAPSDPYHVVVAPKSTLPFEFVQVK
ncbi:zf-HC2 domain-containing protein [bacterium]|nr:MAG: zf-HC2 domain-containing protein [bacterium]